MNGPAPTGWEQDSPTLYLHASGFRIERRLWKAQDGWILVPADLDQAVVRFAPDDEGLTKAFAAFQGGDLPPPLPAAAVFEEEEPEEDVDEADDA